MRISAGDDHANGRDGGSSESDDAAVFSNTDVTATAATAATAPARLSPHARGHV